MILPTKHLRTQRSLIGIGAEILSMLDQPVTVSRLWDDFRESRSVASQHSISFDRFVLALDFLFLIKAVHLRRERLVKGGPQ